MPTPLYTFTGTTRATNIGNYTCGVSLSAGYLWQDGSGEDITHNWKIVNSPVLQGTIRFLWDGGQTGYQDYPLSRIAVWRNGTEIQYIPGTDETTSLSVQAGDYIVFTHDADWDWYYDINGTYTEVGIGANCYLPVTESALSQSTSALLNMVSQKPPGNYHYAVFGGYSSGWVLYVNRLYLGLPPT